MDADAVRQSLWGKFREVTTDRLEKINQALVALEKDPSTSSAADAIAHELHTMKGESRMLGFIGIGQLAHACEDLLRALRDGRVKGAAGTDLLFKANDTITSLLGDLPQAEKSSSAIDDLVRALRALAGAGQGVAAIETKVSRREPRHPAEPAAPQVAPPSEAVPVSAAPQPLPEPAKQADRSVRVAVEMLDDLGSVAGDLLVENERASLRSRELGQLISRFNRLGDRWLSALIQLLPQSPAPALTEGLTRLEGDLSLLRDDAFKFLRKNSDGLNALRSNLSRMADSVADARLVPLSSLFGAFPRAARDIGRQAGKEVELVIDNADVSADRGVLGEVRDALVHLLRNAIDHGLETPEERQALGKPPAGRVAIRARLDGDMLALEVEDDGRGIDPAKLRQAAVEKGVLSPAVAAGLNDREAVDLIFVSGFSTRKEVSDLSGRGVGMDVVRTKVEALGGSVSVASEVGKLTRISLRLPQSLALMKVLLVRLSGDVYGFPASEVESVGRVRSEDKMEVASVAAVSYRGRPVNLVALGPLLSLSAAPKHATPPVVYVKHGEDRAAFVVDGFVGEREVAVKHCGGEFLKGAKFVGGAAVLEDGRVAVLLHVPDLMGEIRRTARSGGSEAQGKRLRVLLVDDSPIARATEAALLKTLGHAVVEAIDGEDALNRMAADTFDLIVTDVQMPRMDGIALTRRLKADAAFAKLPVVVLSSLNSPEDMRRGLDAGADAYLVKGELGVELLAETLDRLV